MNNVQKSSIKNSQVTDFYGPHTSQINPFRNSSVFSCLEVLYTTSSLDVVGELIARPRCIRTLKALSPNLFMLVCGMCSKFLVFDLRYLVTIKH